MTSTDLPVTLAIFDKNAKKKKEKNYQNCNSQKLSGNAIGQNIIPQNALQVQENTLGTSNEVIRPMVVAGKKRKRHVMDHQK